MNENYYSKKLSECINDSKMKQIINEPTGITNNSKILIDHITTNDKNLMSYSILHEEQISEHSTVNIVLRRRDIPNKNEKMKVAKYDKGDVTNFSSNNTCNLPQ